MSRYLMEYTVIQTSTKTIHLEVDAEDENVADDKAREDLNTYPAAIHENGVHRIRVSKEDYELPSLVNCNSIRQDKRFG